MLEFFSAITEHQFVRNAVIAGVLISVAAGVIGAYVVARRITYLAGGISHSVLGGMGIAYYCSIVYGLVWFTPMVGAYIAALISAILIALVSMKAKAREDTVIGAMWAIGMAIGVIFMTITPGYNRDLMGYLFGNILLVSSSELLMIGIVDVVVVACGLLLYNQFQAVCFDQEFARTRGVQVDWYYLLLICLTALTVVMLMTVVGVVLVIALLTLPAAIAGRFSTTIAGTIIRGVIVSLVVVLSGLVLSYSADLPAGAVIVVLAGIWYIIVSLWQWLAVRLKTA